MSVHSQCFSDVRLEAKHRFRTEHMSDNLAFPAVLGSITSCEDVILDVVEGIVEIRFQESVTMAQDVLSVL